MSALLALEGLGCVRGGRALFTGIDLTLAAGDAALVTGPNGAGKSSLLRIIAGLLHSQAGRVSRDGRIGFIDEHTALDSEQSLSKALLFWTRLDGGNRGDVMRGLETMDLVTLSDVPTRILSAGQRKRAALARVIAGNTPIWLLDEPTNGLDDASQTLLEQAINSHREGGGVVIVSTHQAIELPDAQCIKLGEANE